MTDRVLLSTTKLQDLQGYETILKTLPRGKFRSYIHVNGLQVSGPCAHLSVSKAAMEGGAILVDAAMFSQASRWARSRRLWSLKSSRVEFSFFSSTGSATYAALSSHSAAFYLLPCQFLPTPKLKDIGRYETMVRMNSISSHDVLALPRFQKDRK